MASRFDHYPCKPKSNYVLNAYYILCNTHDASSSFYNIFESSRRKRKAKGSSTDEEQDLLRAMLIFSTSGMDSMIKQLIQDSYHSILIKDIGAESVFRIHIEKKIIKNNEINSKLLASTLISNSPRNILIKDTIYELTQNSLQSKDELFRIASFFNIPSNKLTNDIKLLVEIFDVRNKITHEMDIDFSRPNRSRIPRGKDIMFRYTNEILRILYVFINEVDKKLQ